MVPFLDFLKTVMRNKPKRIINRDIPARIPHQSPPKGGDSFSLGEAIAPAALSKLNYNLYDKRALRKQRP